MRGVRGGKKMHRKELLGKIFALGLAATMMIGLVSCRSDSSVNSGNNVEENQDKNQYQLAGPSELLSASMNCQPEVSYWFPEELLDWNPQKDPDLEYNVSTVPLAERVNIDKLTPVNKTQNKDTKIMAISIMNANTSGNLPHGSNTADSNAFTSWQYVDELIYWGGSSGEGLIVPPSPDVTDLAHTNGVPVLGTVFFPQQVAGGKMKWLDTFLKQEADGSFPVADKLAEVAQIYGFEGWFINQETEGTAEQPLTKEHADKMQLFIKYFKEKYPDLRVVYYDSMTVDGKMAWQNALTDKNAVYLLDEKGNQVADEMFLNFWWTNNSLAQEELLKQSAQKAEQMGLNPYDLYAGIDVQANGNNTPIRWDLFMSGENSTYTSLGLYCPSWTWQSSKSLTDMYEKEEKFWVNGRRDPSEEVPYFTKTQWRGLSMFVVKKSAITALPFVTNFNTGAGDNFFKDGNLISQMDWNNRSTGDILPTYRWIVDDEKGNKLDAAFDTEDAWYAGTSVKITGSVSEGKTSVLQLYSADLPIEKKTTFSTVAKANTKTELHAVLTFEDGSKKTIKGDKTVGEAWTKVFYDISDFAGKQIRCISYELKPSAANESYQLNLGNITITNGSEKIAKVTNLTIDEVEFGETSTYAGMRLSWDSDNEASEYEIYRVNEDDTLTLLGVSNVECFYLGVITRGKGVDASEFMVIPVNNTLEEGDGVTVTLEWPEEGLPKAGMKASKTLLAVGERVTFFADCSSNAETILWTMPGASVENAEGDSVSVTYAKEGFYDVTVTAQNEVGEATETIKGFVYVSSKFESGVKLALLSANKATDASAYVNENEAPHLAVDGDTTKKWCATGRAPHHLIIDLGESYTISEVGIAHAQAGGENKDWNTKAYTILVSEDGKNYVPVVEITKNIESNTLDTFAPVNARYVKLSVVKPTQGADSAARIYEVEVFGVEEKLF